MKTINKAEPTYCGRKCDARCDARCDAWCDARCDVFLHPKTHFNILLFRQMQVLQFEGCDAWCDGLCDAWCDAWCDGLCDASCDKEKKKNKRKKKIPLHPLKKKKNKKKKITLTQRACMREKSPVFRQKNTSNYFALRLVYTKFATERHHRKRVGAETATDSRFHNHLIKRVQKSLLIMPSMKMVG